MVKWLVKLKYALGIGRSARLIKTAKTWGLKVGTSTTPQFTLKTIGEEVLGVDSTKMFFHEAHGFNNFNKLLEDVKIWAIMNKSGLIVFKTDQYGTIEISNKNAYGYSTLRYILIPHGLMMSSKFI